jgi:regulator of cell morphogenesis and NO signaling
MIECSLETSVPAWIIDHPGTLFVFQELGIDYSCGGKSLEFACREQGLPEQNVLSKLHEVINGGIQTVNPPSPT